MGQNKKPLVFAFLFTAIGVSSLGDFIYLIALNLSVLEETHSAAAVSALWAIPPFAGILTRFWAGSLVDRLNRKKVLVSMDIVRGILVLTLPFMPSVYGMYVVILLLSCAEVLYRSAFGPYITKLIPDEKRKRMNSLIGMMQTGAIVVGPAIAGVLLTFSTPDVAIAANGFSFLVSSVIFLFLLPNIIIQTTEEKSLVKINLFKTIGADWKKVLLFARGNRYFITIYLLVMVVFIFGSALDSQEVVFAEQALHLGSSGYSNLVAICGVGYVLGAVFVAIFAKRLSTRLLIGFTFLTSVGFVIYALSDAFWMAAFGFIILGFFQSCGSTGLQTFFQNQVPVDIMGRFGSVFGLFQGLGIVLMTVLAGLVSDLAGVKGMVLGGSLIQLLMAAFLVAFLLLPKNLSETEAIKASS